MFELHIIEPRQSIRGGMPRAISLGKLLRVNNMSGATMIEIDPFYLSLGRNTAGRQAGYSVFVEQSISTS